MCWLLIRARSNPKPTAYKAGDIVEVRRDDCNWGSSEGLPSFYRVQITDMPYSDRLQELCQRMDADIFFDPDGERRQTLRRIRRHKIEVTSLPNQIKNALNRDGIVQVTKAQIRNYFKDNDGAVVNIDG